MDKGISAQSAVCNKFGLFIKADPTNANNHYTLEEDKI